LLINYEGGRNRLQRYNLCSRLSCYLSNRLHDLVIDYIVQNWDCVIDYGGMGCSNFGHGNRLHFLVNRLPHALLRKINCGYGLQHNNFLFLAFVLH